MRVHVDEGYIILDEHEEYTQLLDSEIAKECDWCVGVGSISIPDPVVLYTHDAECDNCHGSGLVLNGVPPILQDMANIMKILGRPSKPIKAVYGGTGNTIELYIDTADDRLDGSTGAPAPPTGN